MFPRYIFHKFNSLCKNSKGLTLVELLVVVALIGMITCLISGVFSTCMKSFHIGQDQIDCYSTGRLLYMNLERQIKSSEEIFIKDDKIFIQDLETPIYYNYYKLDGRQIKKYKVNKNDLKPIPLGSVSQFAENIIDFKLEKVKGCKNMLNLKIVAMKDDKEIDLNSHIRVGVSITNK